MKHFFPGMFQIKETLAERLDFLVDFGR